MAFLLTVIAATLACGLEMLEALAIVLAVAAGRSPRDALLGAVAAGATCVLVALVVGPQLIQRSDAFILRIVVGAALLVFGLNWLRKAVLRLARRQPQSSSLDDVASQRDALRSGARRLAAGPDWPARAVAFKGVLLEGLEVVFITAALASHRGAAVPTLLGVGCALVATAAIGVASHRWLRTVSESRLKYLVGVLLTAFGVYFLGSGLGAQWPLGDAALPALVAISLVASQLAIAWLQRGRAYEVSG